MISNTAEMFRLQCDRYRIIIIEMIRTAIIIERTDINLGGAERSISELTSQLRVLDVDVSILAAVGKACDRQTHILCADAKKGRVKFTVFEKAIKKHLAEVAKFYIADLRISVDKSFKILIFKCPAPDHRLILPGKSRANWAFELAD